jgi:hypothetical protein
LKEVDLISWSKKKIWMKKEEFWKAKGVEAGEGV